jgi:hypothetical protein
VVIDLRLAGGLVVARKTNTVELGVLRRITALGLGERNQGWQDCLF